MLTFKSPLIKVLVVTEPPSVVAPSTKKFPVPVAPMVTTVASSDIRPVDKVFGPVHLAILLIAPVPDISEV